MLLFQNKLITMLKKSLINLIDRFYVGRFLSPITRKLLGRLEIFGALKINYVRVN